MSRASNLAGFVSAIYPSDNLSVGFLTVRDLNVTGIATFASIDLQGIEYARVAGVATYAESAGIATVGGVGIHSAGTLIGIATNLNFIGAGNTFAINGDSIDISISGSGGPGASGAIGIASVQKPSNQVDYVGFAVTDLRFVGAAVTGVTDTASGVSTATVTITKTLVIGRRDSGTAQLNISSGDASSLQLRDGSEVTLPLTLG